MKSNRRVGVADDWLKNVDMVVPQFRDVMIGSNNIEVEPESCIPFTNIRPLCKSGVLRLKSIFTASTTSEDGLGAGGISFGSKKPIVVELRGTLKHYVFHHFLEQEKESEEVSSICASREIFYGIIDGLHSHAAIMELKKEGNHWKDYKWFVKCVPGGHSKDRYQNLARMENAKQNDRFYIELTFADTLSNLKGVYHQLVRERKSAKGPDVATSFSGFCERNNRTLIQTANTSIRIPDEVIEAISEISNSEHPDVILSQPRWASSKIMNGKNVAELCDCRIFCKFLNITSLKSVTVFMNAKHEHGSRAQLHCVHRAKHICSLNCYKPVKHESIIEQYTIALDAIEEESKFLAYNDREDWPDGMATLRNTLLKTTNLDRETQENRGNDTTILPSLLDSYRRYEPLMSAVKAARHKASLDSNYSTVPDTHDNNASNVPASQDEEVENSGDGNEVQEDSNSSCHPSDSSPSPTTSPSVPAEENDPEHNDCCLKERKIKCFKMRWQTCLAERSEESERFDAIISEPPTAPSRSYVKGDSCNKRTGNELDKEEANELPKLGKSVLKPGGYFFLICPHFMFEEWYNIFDSSGFKVMGYPYQIMHDPDTKAKRRLTDFPSHNSDYGMLAKLPGLHPDKFLPNFNVPFQSIGACTTRRTASMMYSPSVKQFLTRKNSKVPFHTSEKSFEVISGFIDMFTPQDGSVLDPYAGTFSTAKAYADTSGSCVAVEMDSACFEAALNRLREALKPVSIHHPNMSSSECTAINIYNIHIFADGKRDGIILVDGDGENRKLKPLTQDESEYDVLKSSELKHVG